MWGKTVATLRIEAGHSQRSLAKAAGINRCTLRRLEAGSADIDICHVERILDALGYELDAMKVRDVPKHVINVPCHPKLPKPPKVLAKRKPALIRIRLPREV